MNEEKMATELATELMHELKANAKRWFIAFVVMVVLEVLTIAGFIAYCSLPVEEGVVTQEMQDIQGEGISQNVVPKE